MLRHSSSPSSYLPPCFSHLAPYIKHRTTIILCSIALRFVVSTAANETFIYETPSYNTVKNIYFVSSFSAVYKQQVPAALIPTEIVPGVY